MNLLTPVETAPFARKISRESNILLLGSCFSTNIGQMLCSHGFNTLINPFGVLYNPASIAACLERIAAASTNRPIGTLTGDNAAAGSGINHTGAYNRTTQFGQWPYFTNDDVIDISLNSTTYKGCIIQDSSPFPGAIIEPPTQKATNCEASQAADRPILATNCKTPRAADRSILATNCKASRAADRSILATNCKTPRAADQPILATNCKAPQAADQPILATNCKTPRAADRPTPAANNSEETTHRNQHRYCSFHHHSSLAGNTPEEFLDSANMALTEAAEFLQKADTVIITLGTSYVFRHIERDMIVANCHKINPKEFSRELLSIDEAAECLRRICAAVNIAGIGQADYTATSGDTHATGETRICNKTQRSDGTQTSGERYTCSKTQTTGKTCICSKTNAQDKFRNGNKPHIIFTVSPIRHLADGAHGNLISKSTLLHAIDRITSAQTSNQISYFPSYEIMMDELRDYRFYAEDMVHPSETAMKYIFERFRESAVAVEDYEWMQQEHRKWLRTQHRPFT